MTLQEVVYKGNSRLGKFWLVSVIHPDMIQPVIQPSKGKQYGNNPVVTLSLNSHLSIRCVSVWPIDLHVVIDVQSLCNKCGIYINHSLTGYETTAWMARIYEMRIHQCMDNGTECTGGGTKNMLTSRKNKLLDCTILYPTKTPQFFRHCLWKVNLQKS